MSLIKPVSFITGGLTGPFLTQVDVTLRTDMLAGPGPSFPGEIRGGIENETDADGGVLVGSAQYITPASASVTVSYDLSGLNILWEDRYNYRFGSANVYSILGMGLYLDGVSTENQVLSAGLANGLTSWHGGINLNPSFRNLSVTDTDDVVYPKG